MNLILTLVVLFSSLVSIAKELPELNRSIVDPHSFLSESDKSYLDQQIRDYQNKTSNQIGVVLIDSLDGDNLEQYSMRIFDQWKLGDLKKDNGILLLFVIKDKKFRIEVGRGLEGELTDAESKRIQSLIKNELKNKDYKSAISKEISLIESTIEKNTLTPTVSQPLKENPKPNSLSSEDEGNLLYFGLLLVILIDIVFNLTAINTNKASFKREGLQLISMNKDLEKKTIEKEEIDKIKIKYDKSNLKKMSKLDQEIMSIQSKINKTIENQKEVLEIAKKWENKS